MTKQLTHLEYVINNIKDKDDAFHIKQLISLADRVKLHTGTLNNGKKFYEDKQALETLQYAVDEIDRYCVALVKLGKFIDYIPNRQHYGEEYD
ncbi:MAG: hypothetical protein KJI69_04600 [Patescibacteria group bacterium]|nr:hypothetical protein [Patescibacteria group bacterium]